MAGKKAKSNRPQRRKPQTSAALTRKAKAILQDCRNAYGVKGTLSAAVIYFSTLSDKEQVSLVKDAMREDALACRAEKEAGAMIEGAQADVEAPRKSERRTAG